MTVLDAIACVAIASALIAVPFFLFFALPIWISRSTEPPPPAWRKKIGTISAGIFIGSVLIGLVVGNTSAGIGHDEVLRKLNSLKGDYFVSINGKAVPNSQEIVSVLKTLDWLPAHHSNPTKRIDINISDYAPRLALSLARDSGDPREYWIFWPKYRITTHNEIGRIKTPVFDAY
jgi:hypothetical protein